MPTTPGSPMGAKASVELFWIPLGAGAHLVRLNGKVYEAVSAALARRPRLDVYHAALVIRVPKGLYTVEMTPIPDTRGWERGVVLEGAVGTRWAGRFRIFRYEVRRWANGVIPDLGFAEADIQLSDDNAMAQRVLDALPAVPGAVWGRDELDAGEMWSCNSIISWALTRAGLDARAVPLPARGRAPGWNAGIEVAERLDPRHRPTRVHDPRGRQEATTPLTRWDSLALAGGAGIEPATS